MYGQTSSHPPLRRGFIAAMAAALMVGCGGPGPVNGDDSPEDPVQCLDGTYASFDPAHHQNQEVRVATYEGMVQALVDAQEDLQAAPESFAAAKALFMDEIGSANLRGKLQGREDDHDDPPSLQGDRMDAAIMAWLDFGAAAQSATEVEVARAWVVGSLIEFFYLSVYHEFVLGTAKNWDEAFGYYGATAVDAPEDRMGLARFVAEVDAAGGTALGTEIFGHIVGGSCTMAKTLDASGEANLDVWAHEDLATTIVDADGALELAFLQFALSRAEVIQEALEAGLVDPGAVWVAAAELSAALAPLERLANLRGGEAATSATGMLEALAPSLVSDPESMNISDTAWMQSLDGVSLVNAVNSWSAAVAQP